MTEYTSSKEYCGHWSVEHINRTLQLKRAILKNYHREVDGLVEEIGWMAAEIERRSRIKDTPSE